MWLSFHSRLFISFNKGKSTRNMMIYIIFEITEYSILHRILAVYIFFCVYVLARWHTDTSILTYLSIYLAIYHRMTFFIYLYLSHMSLLLLCFFSVQLSPRIKQMYFICLLFIFKCLVIYWISLILPSPLNKQINNNIRCLHHPRTLKCYIKSNLQEWKSPPFYPNVL